MSCDIGVHLCARTAQAATPRYVIISPVRDEADYIVKTIESVVSQTIRPVQWLLVNDGSTDETAEVIEHWASKEPWIVPVHRLERSHSGAGAAGVQVGNPTEYKQLIRGRRAMQAKEIEAFYEGYERIVCTDWEFLVKLDGDVSFDPEYFERCFAEFHRDPKLGIGGGLICHRLQGELHVEKTPLFHVRGATKIYRRACWDAIGGVLCGAGWDTIDEVKANMLSWHTYAFTGLKVEHHRITGAANGAWQNAVKNGVWNYVCGYHPLFVLLKCGRRAIGKLQLVYSAGLLWGFLGAWLRKIPQIDDRTLIHYLRQQQTRRLLFQKTIWR